VDRRANILGKSNVSKLFLKAEPGSILVGANLDFVRGWPAQTEVTVAGLHFVQEDSPDDIEKAVAEWMRGLG
jgi:haloalkane dehalogenase